MGRIHVLSDDLIDRISAGEIVERPASVVKELVENSLDAGARSVDVRVRGGGKHGLSVVDDGCGMDPEDARLAVERHATSKLARADELEAIATLGFRGEALASIAAVSHLRLRTSTGEGEGTEIEVRGGRIESVRPVGMPRGTEVHVERLFFNTPARRKFLRTDPTELSHVARWLTRYALGHPERHFRLADGQRAFLDAPPVPDLAQRIAQIYTPEFAEKLLAFERVEGHLAVRGFAGRPVDARPRRDAQHFFVNGRAVSDRTLSHAVGQAYGNTMPRGRHPALVLLLAIEPRAVDVNVHPQKTEVRFRDTSAVHEVVRRAVGAALSAGGAVPSLSDLRPGGPAPADGVRASALRFLETHEPQPRADPRGWPGAARPGQEARSRPAAAAARIEGTAPPRVTPLAQLRSSYILAEDADGLLIVDQHAAHERVLFERLLAQAEQERVETQKLLFPVTVELSPDEMATLEGELDELARLGLAVEPFGARTVRIDAGPAVAGEVEPESLLRGLLGEAARARSAAADVPELRRKLVTNAACQAAIKINHPLTGESMQALLDDLYRARNPTTCPHGRPTLFRMSHADIERAFRRR